jgi:hypothetical protein
MKFSVLVILLVMVISPGFCVYEIGDVVDNFSWLESDGGDPVERSLYELIDQEKVVLIFFGSAG